MAVVVESQWVRLVDAAARLRVPYRQAFDLMLTGKVEGRRDELGRWTVSSASIAQFLDRRSELGASGR
jgi:hypothetical protein